MTVATVARPKRKKRGDYHHGDLRRALLTEALRTIQTAGVEDLTLRTVGDKLGVSRSALYRHFSDKQALLAAVSTEGFRMLRLALTDAWEHSGRGRTGFEAMGLAYIEFAATHPSHYRVMFGRFLESCARDAELLQESRAAFQVLVEALIALQQEGAVRRDDPMTMALFVWSAVHGIAMLSIDGQLAWSDRDRVPLNEYVVARVRDAIKNS